MMGRRPLCSSTHFCRNSFELMARNQSFNVVPKDVSDQIAGLLKFPLAACLPGNLMTVTPELFQLVSHM